MRNTVFQARYLSSKFFPGQEKCSFHKCDGKKAKFEFFVPKFWNDRKIYKFFEENFSSICSSRHRECTFNTHGSNFFPEDKTFFCSKPKMMINFVHFPEKSFFLKVFAGHEKRKHDNYTGMNSLNSDLFSAQSPKRWTKMYTFYQNKFSSICSLDRRKEVLTSMPEQIG